MSSESKIKVMIVDDHAIVREGIAEVLEQSGEFEVVGQAGDGELAVELAQELGPDVIIMDIVMPFKDGIAACRDITAVLPDTRVLMLTASNRDSAIVQAVNAGATGYLQKFSGKEMLLSTLREVAGGEFSLQGEAARRLVTGMGGAPGPVPPSELDRLTVRERDLLRMFARGMSYVEIAEVRGNKNPMTVRNAVYAIRRKLGVGSRQEMGVWAARSGLLDDDELL
ncbi:MAG: response regulator transcription factor [Caldilineaceae bacterium SB0668_bin_21]|nr:response regulator transcription factor [Caldilineaceae bacterium SB0668_bin_21]MYC22339.1 response regulator transcription factor [Caldilineaceae bacterium SB0662_bin_25]